MDNNDDNLIILSSMNNYSRSIGFELKKLDCNRTNYTLIPYELKETTNAPIGALGLQGNRYVLIDPKIICQKST